MFFSPPKLLDGQMLKGKVTDAEAEAKSSSLWRERGEIMENRVIGT